MKKLSTKIFEFLFTYYDIYKLKKENIVVKELSLPQGFLFKELDLKDFYLFKNLDLKENYLKICLDRIENKKIISYAIIDTNKECLAAYSFINLSDEYYLAALNKKINLKKMNCVFFEDDNTLIDYRKMGLSSYIMNQRVKFAKLNNKDALGFAHPKNTPSIKTLKKFNFKKTYNFPFALRKEAFKYIIKKISW
jgi:hypothetical protein